MDISKFLKIVAAIGAVVGGLAEAGVGIVSLTDELDSEKEES